MDYFSFCSCSKEMINIFIIECTKFLGGRKNFIRDNRFKHHVGYKRKMFVHEIKHFLHTLNRIGSDCGIYNRD